MTEPWLLTQQGCSERQMRPALPSSRDRGFLFGWVQRLRGTRRRR